MKRAWDFCPKPLQRYRTSGRILAQGWAVSGCLSGARSPEDRAHPRLRVPGRELRDDPLGIAKGAAA